MQGTKEKISEKMFTYGIGCHAILAIHSVGLLDQLKKRAVSEIEINENERYPHPMAVIGALQALEYANIVKKEKKQYFLTEEGKEVAEHIDMYIHWFQAYGKLMAHSVDIVNNQYFPEAEIDYDLSQVAYSASLIKRRLITPVLKKVISQLHPQGVLCDMGCSSGEVLISLCESFQVDGLGFEKNPRMVELANKNIQMNTNSHIHAHYADYTQIKGQYPEVDILICDFFAHHITDDETCLAMLRSFRSKFPNSRYMLFMDNFTPEDKSLSPSLFAPAFDYVHRLQKIETRNLASLERILHQTNFRMVERIDLEIPNGYLWVMEMDEYSKK
jgi:methylase of polypeptide subunit release factors